MVALHPPYGTSHYGNPYEGAPGYHLLWTYHMHRQSITKPPSFNSLGHNPTCPGNPLPPLGMSIPLHMHGPSCNPNCSGGESTSYNQYGTPKHNNPYYPFPSPPQPNAMPP
jgi:hypothetical protein